MHVSVCINKEYNLSCARESEKNGNFIVNTKQQPRLEIEGEV